MTKKKYKRSFTEDDTSARYKETEETIRKIDIKKDRLEIARIIRINLPLMNINKFMCQEVADCILAYLIGAI